MGDHNGQRQEKETEAGDDIYGGGAMQKWLFASFVFSSYFTLSLPYGPGDKKHLMFQDVTC